jgi:glycosyltransferase involved in cell wall biosynthesis
VVERFADARLHVVGGEVKFGEAYRRRVSEMIAERGLEGSVLLHGRVDDAALANQLQRAALVLIPEQWENMSPLMLLRAMETAKPIVASRIGGIPEFARHEREALLCEASDARAFGAAMVRLLEDRALAAQLAAAARQRVRRLCDPARSRDGWVDLYRELGLR